MKFIKLAAVLLVLAGGFVSCKSNNQCAETINLPEEKVCDFTNPLTDLPWLKEYIDEVKEQERSIAIFTCSYRNGTGFLFYTGCPKNVYCITGPSIALKNCEGETLCVTFGANVMNCEEEFDVDFNNITLIYEVNCPY